MAFLEIETKDLTTPLTPLEFNYLIEKLNTRRLRDLIDVQDSDAQDKNIIQHNGSGWVYYTISDDFYTKAEINLLFGVTDIGDIPQLTVDWGAIGGTIVDQTDLFDNFGDLNSASNIWAGLHYANNYILNGSSGSVAVVGEMDSFRISDGVNAVDVFDGETITITGSSVSFDYTSKEFEITVLPTIEVPILLTFSTDNNTRNSINNIHGGITMIVEEKPLSISEYIDCAVGISKLMIALEDGADYQGTIRITGTRVDRNTGEVTVGFVEHLDVDGETSNTSGIDSLGYFVWGFHSAYITSNWFVGDVIISTEDVEVLHTSVFQVGFEQFNDSANITLDTFDATFDISSTLAEYSFHLYLVIIKDSSVDVVRAMSAVRESANINPLMYRVRRSNLNIPINGTDSGIFIDANLGPLNQTYFDSLVIKLWATKTIDLFY